MVAGFSTHFAKFFFFFLFLFDYTHSHTRGGGKGSKEEGALPPRLEDASPQTQTLSICSYTTEPMAHLQFAKFQMAKVWLGEVQDCIVEFLAWNASFE